MVIKNRMCTILLTIIVISSTLCESVLIIIRDEANVKDLSHQDRHIPYHQSVVSNLSPVELENIKHHNILSLFEATNRGMKIPTHKISRRLYRGSDKLQFGVNKIDYQDMKAMLQSARANRYKRLRTHHYKPAFGGGFRKSFPIKKYFMRDLHNDEQSLVDVPNGMEPKSARRNHRKFNNPINNLLKKMLRKGKGPKLEKNYVQFRDITSM